MEEDRRERIESQEPSKPPVRSRILLAWVGASIGGWLSGFLLGSLAWFAWATFVYQPSFAEQGIAFSVPVALAGLGACVMQGEVLKRRAPEVGGWVWTSSLAWILAGPVVAAVNGQSVAEDYFVWAAPAVALVTAGAMIGATQWLTLQGRASGAWRWIVASAVGWGLGAAVPVAGIEVAIFGMSTGGPVGPLLLAVCGAVVGHAITGIALARCLRQPPRHPVNRQRSLLLVGFFWLLQVAAAVLMLFR